jgi:hypothetical protein
VLDSVDDGPRPLFAFIVTINLPVGQHHIRGAEASMP